MTDYDYMINKVNELAEQRELERQRTIRWNELTDKIIQITTVVFFILNSVGIIVEIVLLLKILG